MSSITTGSHPRFLLGGMFRIYGTEYKQLNAVGPMVYDVMKSDKNFEEVARVTGLGLAVAKGEGEPITIDTTRQDQLRRTSHTVWEKSCRITREAIKDNLHMNQVQKLGKAMAKSLFHTKETNAAALFNNATSTSVPYLGADSKAFLATDHPTGAGTTFSNLSASDISELALENAMITMDGWVDNDAQLIDSRVKCLLVPPNNKFEAYRILKSELQAGVANNDINALRSRNDIPKILEWKFLTDTNSWFLLTENGGLVHYVREAPESSYEQEYLTKNHIYSIIERYSHDYTDPRAVLGSVGAS
jgi:hypothetical protein